MKFARYTVIFACLVFASATNSNANELYSFPACVQKSLNALGYDAGPVNGKLGSKSQSAASVFLSRNPEFSELRKLSNQTADKWCLELSTKYQESLPLIVVLLFLEHANPTEVRHTLSKANKESITSALLEISRRPKDSLNKKLEIDSIVTIISGNNKNASLLEIYHTVKARSSEPIISEQRYNIPSYAPRNPLILVDGTSLNGSGYIEHKVKLDGLDIAALRITR